MDWLRKLFGGKSDLEMMLELATKTHAIDAELLRNALATIDRVVAARYDRPTYAQESPLQSPAPINPADLNDVLTDGDDEAFLSRLDRLEKL